MMDTEEERYYKGDESAAAPFLCNKIGDKSEKKKADNLALTFQKLHLASINDNILDLYGTVYRWLIVKPSNNDTVEAASTQKIMQICDAKGKWIDLFERKESTITSAKMELFALKRFSRHECISIFAGHCCWKLEEGQEIAPTYAYLTEQGIKDSDYSINIYSSLKKQWMCIDPSKEKKYGKMYMGAHFINSATLGYKAGSPLHNSAIKNQNSRIFVDGLVYATKCINKGDEFFTRYTNSSNEKTELEKKAEKNFL